VIVVVVAPPYLAVQDHGRPGYRASGVPAGGAMDGPALDRANRWLHNDPRAAGLEWALGGGVIRFETATRIALAGAETEARLDDVPVNTARAIDVPRGATLAVGRFTAGRFLYVAISGGIDVPRVLGSRSTYLPGHFGGLGGRLLRAGDLVPVSDSPPVRVDRSASASLPAPVIDPGGPLVIRALRGPDYARFPSTTWDAFCATDYRISVRSDRIGYRLDGAALSDADVGTLASAPLCPGAVQVPPDGRPIVLMADGPTVGGYPVLAVVRAADRASLAQAVPGAPVRFAETPA
jgi:biotin-dependent carboxylase-like uncharacterized protein